LAAKNLAFALVDPFMSSDQHSFRDPDPLDTRATRHPTVEGWTLATGLRLSRWRMSVFIPTTEPQPSATRIDGHPKTLTRAASVNGGRS
jgi:hypothetical protein